MEQRKVMSLGRSSLVISLPKYWVKLNELKQGDAVSIAIQRDRSLVVFPGSKVEKEEKKITLTIQPNEETNLIIRKIIACYLNGYFGIRLVAKHIFSVVQQKAIRDITGKLYLRIMESNAKSIYIQTLIDETQASIDSSVQRMHAIALSMYKDALDSLKQRDVALARAVLTLDDDVDHFSYFILRLLHSVTIDPVIANQLGFDPIDCLHYQTFVHRIEQIADRAAIIAKHIILLDRLKQRIPQSTLELLILAGDEVLTAYDRVIKAFFSKDIMEANKIIELQNKVDKFNQEIASHFVEITSPTICCAVCSSRDSIRETMERVKDIAEIIIDYFFEDKSDESTSELR